MSQGKFVILEGGDCSGKTTFMRFLKEKHPFPEFCYTNEPGGNEYGMKIRHLLLHEDFAEASDNLTKFHLYWASKAENFRKVIFPQLKAGCSVISDRFEGSTFAYQLSEDHLLEYLFWQTRHVCLKNVIPVYMFFDVSADVAIARGLSRKGEQNYFDIRKKEYREKVQRSYRRFFDNKSIKSFRVDANLPQDEMLVQAYGIFKKIVGL